jgi:uncharacterized protein (DUF885 family)
VNDGHDLKYRLNPVYLTEFSLAEKNPMIVGIKSKSASAVTARHRCFFAQGDSCCSRSTTMTTTTSACFLHNEMASTWQWRIDTDPELAASLGLLSKRRSKHALDPRSPASFEKRLEWIQRALWRMEEGLTPEQSSTLAEGDKLSYRLYMGQLRDYINYTTKHRAFLCCVNRLEGPQTDLPLYARYLSLKNKSHREFYKKFLEGVPVQLSEVMELLQIGLKEGRTPPSVSLDGVIDMIRAMIAGKMISFSGPISGDEVFDLPEEMDLKVECMELVSKITEAFTKFADFLEKDYVHNLRTEISAAKGYPEGENYYRDCLTFHTTTDLSPTEIHQLGLDEVARISKEMNEIATHAGYEGRLEGYMEYLRTNSKYEPTSADALCAHYRDITGRIGPELLKIFHLKTLPRSPFSIVETPASQASIAAYYLSGSIDSVAPRPGVFYVNTSELKTRRTYECEALALHESIPGHHTQAAIQNESEGLPDFRRYAEDRRYFEAPCRFPFYTGYIEGWGLHSGMCHNANIYCCSVFQHIRPHQFY